MKHIHNPVTGTDYPVRDKVISGGKVNSLWPKRFKCRNCLKVFDVQGDNNRVLDEYERLQNEAGQKFIKGEVTYDAYVQAESKCATLANGLMGLAMCPFCGYLNGFHDRIYESDDSNTPWMRYGSDKATM